MRRFDIASLCAPGIAFTAALVAGPAPAAEHTPAEAAAWVATATDIAPAQVVLVTPEHVYSLEPLGARAATGEAVALVRTEAFAETATRKVQSWEAYLLFDCRGSRVRLIRSADYRERNRRGVPTATAEVGAWMSPSPGQPAAALLAAACNPDFDWPLRDVGSAGRLALARLDPTPPAPLPQVEALPKSAQARVYAIQVARGPSPDGARRALKAARQALGPTAVALTAATEHSKAGARDRYAAVLAGFATEAEAGAACATLRAARQDCLVRAALDSPDLAAAPPPAYAVQVAYGPSQEGAALAIRRARRALGPQAATLKDISEASPGGDRHTAILSGFETAGAAARACEVLQKAQLTCFARPAPERPAPEQPLELAAR